MKTQHRAITASFELPGSSLLLFYSLSIKGACGVDSHFIWGNWGLKVCDAAKSKHEPCIVCIADSDEITFETVKIFCQIFYFVLRVKFIACLSKTCIKYAFFLELKLTTKTILTF